MEPKRSILTGIVETFLRGNLSILLILVSLAVGVFALRVTPREEEPQIVVPLADVLVEYPGGSAEEVERLVASRLERLLYQIDGVEYVYSMSRPGAAVVTVRFYVGEDREESLIKLYNKIMQNVDRVTPGITGWVVKPVEIDDVPIVNIALYSERYDTHELYRVAEEVIDKLQHVHDTARISIHGGEARTVHVRLDPRRLAAHNLSPLEVAGALRMSNRQGAAGDVEQANTSVRIDAGPFLQDAREVADLIVGVHAGRPVYLRDVAEIVDGPAEATTYSRIGFGPTAQVSGLRSQVSGSLPAVTIAVAKKKGSNAVTVARDVERALQELRAGVLPDEVQARVTRNYGETANEKVNNLVQSLGEAVVTVIALVALAMSWRVALIVSLAIPITYSLTLLVNLLAGYTINRVTLFALILALGLLVDDPIVGVENIYRHLKMRRGKRDEAIVSAMNEVLSPLVLATLSVIVAFLPMFFITGMMGPYMRPMALNVPLAMLCSLLVSLTITPWVSSLLLKDKHDAKPEKELSETRTFRVYARVVRPLLESPRKARGLLWITAGLFVLSLGLALGVVPLKMLPFDNKNELQLVVDLPEHAALEQTDACVRDLERYLAGVPEVTDFTSLAGAGSPMDFNGLVRHYYLRAGPHLADIRINLAPRKERKLSSHGIALRMRADIEAIGRKWNAEVKIVESPPGPPVLATIVAEIYGRPGLRYEDLIAAAATVEDRLRKERGVVDVDTYVEDNRQRLFFRTDREKAALNGIATDDIVSTLGLAVAGLPVGILHIPHVQNETPILLRLPLADRSDVAQLKTVPIKGRSGDLVQLGELGTFESDVVDRTIYHKNLERVVYVTSDTAGRGPAYPVLAVQKHFKNHPLPAGLRASWTGEGEWKITVDVFRDLGLAFAAALLAIFVLLVYETGSYALPGVIMLSIPLTMIGIMPGFSLLNVFANRTIGGFQDPVFFTATAMIGMIALAGIVVRNGIILIDFIRHAVAEGRTMNEAILESGAVRFRPIFLTAGTTMLGAWPITLDPIFSGLAWSLIFGLFVSTAFTLIIIPVVYGMLYGKKRTP